MSVRANIEPWTYPKGLPMNFGTDHLRLIWTVFYVKKVGFMLGTAHYNRRGKLVNFRPGIAESWTISPHDAGHRVSIVPPSGQEDQVKPLCNPPIVGKEQQINMNMFNVRGRRGVALPVEYTVHPESLGQIVTVIAITRYGMSIEEFLQRPSSRRARRQISPLRTFKGASE